MSRPCPATPPAVVRRLLENPTVGVGDAFALLGLAPTSQIGYAMVNRYRKRTLPLQRDGLATRENMRPLRDEDGAWVEIPNDRVGGKTTCRSDLLLEMIFPEGVPDEWASL